MIGFAANSHLPAGALVLIVLVTGCNTTTAHRADNGAVSPAGHQTAHATPADLPAKQAALVCKATAEELDKHGRYQQAIAQYHRARQHHAKIAGISHRLALLYDRTGQTVKAAEEFQRALAESPNDVNLLNDIGYFHYRHRNLSQAEAALRRAVALNPPNQRAWTNLGLVLGESGKYDESYQAFAKSGDPTAAQSNLGMILARHGDQQNARNLLQQSIAANPAIEPAKAALQHLKRPARDGRNGAVRPAVHVDGEP